MTITAENHRAAALVLASVVEQLIFEEHALAGVEKSSINGYIQGAAANIRNAAHPDQMKLPAKVLSNEYGKVVAGGFASGERSHQLRAAYEKALNGQPAEVIRAACDILAFNEVLGGDADTYWKTWGQASGINAVL